MKPVFAMVGLLALAYFGGNAYMKSQSELSVLAEKNGLNEAEKAAFMSCIMDMRGKTLSHNGPSGKTTMTAIPPEICICHSRTMVKLFRDNRYSGHGGVVDTSSTAKKFQNWTTSISSLPV